MTKNEDWPVYSQNLPMLADLREDCFVELAIVQEFDIIPVELSKYAGIFFPMEIGTRAEATCSFGERGKE